MSRFIQQQIQPMTERSVPNAPCPSCPSQALNRKNMNQEEMRKEFMELYDMMAMSHDVRNMETFGNVHKEMMEWMIQNKPDLAQEWIGKLESIKWCNYLTPKEAEKIVSEMVPRAPWSREVWKNAMQSLGLPMEEEPYYNSCALWVVMNQVYTDHAQTIADNILKKPLAEIPADQLVPGIRALALDLLKDKDKNYCVRSYFGL